MAILYALNILRFGARVSIQRGVILCCLALACASPAAETTVQFTGPGKIVSCYDFAEGVLRSSKPRIDNPFTDVMVKGSFGLKGEKPLVVEGFCDSSDGSVYRIRFMPSKPGQYHFQVKYQDGTQAETYE